MYVKNFRSVALKLGPQRSAHTYIHTYTVHTDRRVKQDDPGGNQSTSRSAVLVSIQYWLVKKYSLVLVCIWYRLVGKYRFPPQRFNLSNVLKQCDVFLSLEQRFETMQCVYIT